MPEIASTKFELCAETLGIHPAVFAATADELIEAGWEDVPRKRIPEDWRVAVAPAPVVIDRYAGAEELYSKGLTLREIAAHFGVNHMAIRRRLIKAGLVRRSVGPRLFSAIVRRRVIA